jgi:glycosyltransferase involved in cell wall biosynthesis
LSKPTPILFVSDSPSAGTGLARITKDLSTRLHTHCSDIYRVACLGYGSPGSRSLPFPCYYMTSTKDWMIPDLPEVWEDFAGDEPGIIFTIWDPSRLLWFGRPDNPMHCPDARLRHFLTTANIQKWGYFPIDAHGPHGRLSLMQGEAILGFDRILTYSEWARNIIERSLTEDDCRSRFLAALPHGIDTSVFRPRKYVESRRLFHDVLGYKGPPFGDDEKLIGIVATNQMRKDYGLAIQALAALKLPFRFFIHTDTLERYWSIPALVMDYNITFQAIVNCAPLGDDLMSRIYSACDVTLGIGLGEGFGYPTFESLACGTPHVTGAYGGHAEHLKGDMVTASGWRLEGVYNQVRPVYDPKKWLYYIEKTLAGGKDGISRLPSGLDWNNLWPRWQNYFTAAHQTLHAPPALARVERDSIPETSTAVPGQNT